MQDFETELWGHYDSVRRFALSLTRNQDDADDVTQEVMLAAFAGKNTFEGRSSLSTWLGGITKNKVYDLRRKRKRLVYGEEYDNAVELLSVNSNQLEHLELQELLGRIDTLSPEHREALIDTKISELTVKEAAEQAGVPVGTVKTRVHYARKHFTDFTEGRVHARSARKNVHRKKQLTLYGSRFELSQSVIVRRTGKPPAKVRVFRLS